MTIPILRPQAITPAWLTSVLHAGGVAAIVREFTMTRVGTGQIGQSVKFILDYADALAHTEAATALDHGDDGRLAIWKVGAPPVV